MRNRALVSIVALARSGAPDRAWRVFGENGLDRVMDDPAVLAVRGRLLKDRAAMHSGVERVRLYGEAAAAYAQAHALDGATYPLINAATLSLLAGETDEARLQARRVLVRLDLGGEDDTPYWLGATRAEALLLLGDEQAARAALAEAMRLAPRAYEDHASTLRQFALILAAQGSAAGWLDALRPPRTLSFAGHIALEPDDPDVARRVADWLAAENVGAGFGALAAGADIVVAEALLERGAELHLVLPAGPDDFRGASVAAFGDAWAERFDAIATAAESIRYPCGKRARLTPLAIRLASEVAMGMAVTQASVLQTEAVQFLILDREAAGAGGESDWAGALWQGSGRRQQVLDAVRARVSGTAGDTLRDERNACLAAVLRICATAIDEPAESAEAMSALAVALNTFSPLTVKPLGDTVLAAFSSILDAARAALRAARCGIPEMRIAGHYGVARLDTDPFGGTPSLAGSALTAPILGSTPPGAIHVTDNFAAALFAGPPPGDVRTELVGELPMEDVDDPMRLFALKH